MSASCCTIVLLQASIAVFRNSISGSAVATLEPLCLIELLGNLLCCVVDCVPAWLGLLEDKGAYSGIEGFKVRVARIVLDLRAESSSSSVETSDAVDGDGGDGAGIVDGPCKDTGLACLRTTWCGSNCCCVTCFCCC